MDDAAGFRWTLDEANESPSSLQSYIEVLNEAVLSLKAKLFHTLVRILRLVVANLLIWTTAPCVLSIEYSGSHSSTDMNEATGTPGTLYALKDETNPAATQTTSAYWPVSPSIYNLFATTYAIGVDGDGGTTYVVSQEVTSVDFFNSFTPPFDMFTEPRTAVQTMVAGASYQKGTVAFFPTNMAAPAWVPKIEYTCSYDLGEGSGRCVHAYIYGADTTGYMTLEGGLQVAATMTPFSANGLASDTQSESFGSTRHKVSTGAIVGGVIGGILALIVLITIFVVMRRRRLRSRRY